MLSNTKRFCNALLDDDVRKAYYGKQQRPYMINELKCIFSKRYTLKISESKTVKVSINISEQLDFHEYYMKIKVNKSELYKSSKILSNLLVLVNSKDAIEDLAMECILKAYK